LAALAGLLLAAALVLLVGLLATLMLLVGLLAALILLIRLLATALLLARTRIVRLTGGLIGIVLVGHSRLLEVCRGPSRPNLSTPRNEKSSRAAEINRQRFCSIS
jgi:hypothetical protein